MALLTLSRDPVPGWAKIDLQLHQPYRAFFGLGRLRCDWCGERWGRHGCPSRESAARQFVYTASAAQRRAALDSGDLVPADLRLRRRAPAHHRRRPGPSPRRQPSPNPLAALSLTELAAATR
ncbi:hypothetical protein LO763_12210 [Glycomyces sp. A-F 0318]|uniref:hypothetical protein n=1 Tax=Glycomyces amatae TaxID=2881355 RepID=UPI001E633A32|nr:hypothetical protein [Glycomyces amatae]MCD0444386.1 hypothetical protein [Glycomyces amatae]